MMRSEPNSSLSALTERRDRLSAGPTPVPDWPLATSLEFGPLLTAARSARYHVKLVLMEWGLTCLSDTAELLVSELVTNGVKASTLLPGPVPSPVRLRMASDRLRLVLGVWDGSGRSPEPGAPEEWAEGGRGLGIVETLSTRWGWYPTPQYGGKVVWVELGSAEPQAVPHQHTFNA